ncbi:phosphate ABC transporter permease PstA [Galbitalea soli]|uniref:Phosphate transport system permease protein PstA n=1 Tax=Galbitalea soli TaxID=1268042 RepID=A0A7C9TRV1_9MICO|nr:phosphate ABC transporter permease PstA [Galbitalea soli]NEM92318.1 phosphate ABC transporter permease PstA [Galbitalea soli]NYJ31726.1 phosphate transport system permease protein [Galbitalea soli]
MTAVASGRMVNSLTTGRLPRGSVWMLLIGSWVLLGLVFLFVQLSGATKSFNLVGAIFLGTVLFDVLIFVISLLVEGVRKAKDRLVTSLVATAFIVALLPLVSLLWTVVQHGLGRMIQPSFFSMSMRNVLDGSGGVVHALYGTLEITLATTIISVPIGLMTAIYLVEYGRGPLARAITFLVDVMTGIPSIVAGLFAFALFALLTGNPGFRSGFAGAVALSVLMIPVIVRSSEEMLKLVANELREAAFALGVPKWLTVLKVVLPTALPGIMTGITLAIARVIGETAPLLIASGYSDSVNFDLFSNRMMSLPVFVYTQYANQGSIAEFFTARSWAAALTLILIVMLLNLAARLVARIFSPKLGR